MNGEPYTHPPPLHSALSLLYSPSLSFSRPDDHLPLLKPGYTPLYIALARVGSSVCEIRRDVGCAVADEEGWGGARGDMESYVADGVSCGGFGVGFVWV
ncbi:hypothetical protein NMY22_g8301 [Coprinellus aureogranulatus]|nr:hypothetical protein NMY22_g8301 [Coprinellus aureogranulatus]